MSGGSFNYVCFKLESSEIFQALDDLRDMEQSLRDRQKHEAANEIYRFILLIETCKNRLDVAGKRLHDLTYETEWWFSGDHGEESVDKAMEKLINGDQ